MTGLILIAAILLWPRQASCLLLVVFLVVLIPAGLAIEYGWWA